MQNGCLLADFGGAFTVPEINVSLKRVKGLNSRKMGWWVGGTSVKRRGFVLYVSRLEIVQ